jgi:hypothetical protein
MVHKRFGKSMKRLANKVREKKVQASLDKVNEKFGDELKRLEE